MRNPSHPSYQRDLRIDFFRGLALVMIFINHIPNNPLSLLTLRSWGLADAAEVFVLLAGIAAALAYARYFENGQFSIGVAHIAARIWSLYILHLMLFLALAAMCILAAEHWNETSYLELLGFDVFFQSPARFIADVITLTFLPGYLDILPLYIVLLAFIPVAFLLARIHWALPLLVSFVLYIAAQILPLNLPNTRLAREWFFNPFAWQFLLIIGFSLGRFMGKGYAVQLPKTAFFQHGITLCAGLIVMLAFVIGAPWREFAGWENVVLINPGIMGTISKTNLHPARLLDILAKLWLVVLLVSAHSFWLQTAPAQLISKLGRHSLEVFVLATLLSVAAGIFLTLVQFDMLWVIAINILGVMMMVAFAQFSEWRRISMRATKLSGASLVEQLALAQDKKITST